MFYCSEKTWSFMTNNYFTNGLEKYVIKRETHGNWSSTYYINAKGENEFNKSMICREVKDEPSLAKLLRETVCYGSPEEIIANILKIVSTMDMLLFSVIKHDPNQLYTRGCDTAYYSIQQIGWNDAMNKIYQGQPVLATVENDDKSTISIDTTIADNMYRKALINVLNGKDYQGFVIVDPSEVTLK